MRITFNTYSAIDEHTTALNIGGAARNTSISVIIDSILVPYIDTVEAGRETRWSWNPMQQRVTRLISKSHEPQKREFLHQKIALLVYNQASLADISQIIARDGDWTNLRFSNLLVSFVPHCFAQQMTPDAEAYKALMGPTLKKWGINVH